MRHHIDPRTLGPHGAGMARAVSTCVHCGFCLPACPTYRTLGEEMDSPRGRILLMKSVLERDISLDDALPYIDRCLGCLACVTACPSGVAYGDLLTPFRMQAETMRRRSWMDRLRRRMVMSTLPYPGRFRLAAQAGRLARYVRGLVPGALHAMLDLVPADLPRAQPLPALQPAIGQRRARVALLAGCAQQVLAPEIGWAALRVLSRCGVEVVVPPQQACCGALAMHVGEEAVARDLARTNLRAFPDDVDAIVTTAAGCGSGMREYGLLFHGTADEAAATKLAARVKDVSEFLDALGVVNDVPPLPQPLRVAYQDACHLAHGQGVRSAPRALLQRIPNVTVVEIADGGYCCGSAGTYNIDQPAIARELGEREAAAIRATGAQAVASGNIGCLTQIRTHLREGDEDGRAIEVVHTIELLDRAMASASHASRPQAS
jgi:glycolate oxidase iron-sulfur subunit